MSNCISKLRGKLLSQTAMISLVAVLGAGCSSDFSRLDDPYVTASLPTGNQNSIIKKSAIPNQPYPGNVDNMTTASTGRNVAAVSSGRAIASQPYPTEVTSKPLNTNARRMDQVLAAEKVTSATLTKNIPVNQVESVLNKTVTSSKKYDRLPSAKSTTSVVSSASSAQAAGWTSVGGTRVSLKQGESLHNLSRRYGVPVNQIMRVNKISDASDVVAGQKILIPTYTYSRKAAVSAPDSNSKTLASRSSRGLEGEVTSSHIATPTPKYARSAKIVAVATPVRVSKSNDIGAKVHLVSSGDTLSSIAQRYGVDKAAIRDANTINGDVVRLGQKLQIPAQSNRVASNAKADPVVTSSTGPISADSKRQLSKSNRPATYTRPEVSAAIATRASEKGPTPNQTGVSTFRWPAKGQVVGKFGSKQNGTPNDGIDISVPVGTAVKATENGTVIYAGSELEEFGKLILVRHAGGWVSAYAHSSQNLVNRGDTVRRGQTIARSGRSGTATIPKIHFELRKNSNPVNPLKHLAQS
jgi:murein DD-endopeptidase MepM/ murein hydrolase activator NlpD